MADETVEQPGDEEALPAGEGATEESLPVGEAEAAEEIREQATGPANAPATGVAAGRGAGPAARTAEGGPRPNPRKVREGLVVSDRMDGTVVVAVNERVRHSRYGKIVQRTKRLYVHDGENTAKVGDRVRVVETRPLSKLKRWRLADVLERAR
jgi:small subunit ribosomal protein S17